MVVSGQRVQGDGGVRERATGTHLGGHPDRFHDLGVAGTGTVRELRVAGDAVRALGDVRDRDGDELLGFCGSAPSANTCRLNSSNA